MKIIINMILLFIALTLVGCTNNAEEGENREVPQNEEIPSDGLSDDWFERWAAQVYSEENWEKLREIFETNGDELVRLVEYLMENDLITGLSNSGIRFFNCEEGEISVGMAPGWDYLVINNGEIILSRSDLRLARLFGNDPELLGIVSEIGMRGLLWGISILPEYLDTHVRIYFTINLDHTPFTSELHPGAPNYFLYVEGNHGMEQSGYRQLRDEWYMRIAPPRDN